MAASQFFATPTHFRRWLAANASTSVELIVGFHTVGTGRPSMGWSEAVDEAICVGWIDGVRKRIDAHAYQIRFTPRKPTSIWSAINIAKFHRLQAEGRIQPAGAEAFAHRTDAKSVVYAYEQAEPSSLSNEEVREINFPAPRGGVFAASHHSSLMSPNPKNAASGGKFTRRDSRRQNVAHRAVQNLRLHNALGTPRHLEVPADGCEHQELRTRADR